MMISGFERRHLADWPEAGGPRAGSRRSISFAASISFWLGVVAGLLVTVAVGSALAEPTAAEKETARALVKSGREKRASGDLKGALADFQAAHAVMHVPTTGIEV